MRKTILVIFLGFIIVGLFKIGKSVDETVCGASNKPGTQEYERCLADIMKKRMFNHGDD